MLGRLRDIAGWREQVIEPAPDTLHGLRARLAQQDGVLGQALQGPGVQAAVNKVVVRGDAPLLAGDEVAFMPPMSGG